MSRPRKIRASVAGTPRHHAVVTPPTSALSKTRHPRYLSHASRETETGVFSHVSIARRAEPDRQNPKTCVPGRRVEAGTCLRADGRHMRVRFTVNNTM